MRKIKMKNSNITAIALAISLTFSISAMAENMSKNQYKSQEKNIESEYKSAKSACAALAGNANDICVAKAKGIKNVTNAELKSNYKPSAKSRYGLRIAKADAEHSVAIEMCDDKAGNVKDVCVKEADAIQVHQIADAKFKAKTMKANAEAKEESAEANADAREKAGDAYSHANADKNNADYAVAKEKCDLLAGNAKDTCMDQAKVRFSK
jgi:hypothetical protein